MGAYSSSSSEVASMFAFASFFALTRFFGISPSDSSSDAAEAETSIPSPFNCLLIVGMALSRFLY